MTVTQCHCSNTQCHCNKAKMFAPLLLLHQILSLTPKSKGAMQMAADGLCSQRRTERQVTSDVCLVET